MKLNREVKAGLLVIVSLAILIWGINFLKGHDLFFSGNRYYGIYNRVDGLSEASPIYYKGFKIGTVRDIEIIEGPHISFVVSFDINKDVRFPGNTLAEIYSLDLMGSKGVQFIEGDGKTYLQPGDTLKSSVMGDFVDQMSMQVLPLKEKTEKLIVKLDSSLTKLSGFFNEANRQHFSNTLANLDIATANFTEMSALIKTQMQEGGSLNTSMHNLESFTTTLNDQKGQISKTIGNLAEFTQKMNDANIDQTVSRLNSTLLQADSLLAAINNGEGTAGMVLHDKELYYRLNDASANLDRLLVDIRHNPKRYFSFSAIDFGKRVYIQSNGLEGAGIVFMVLIDETREPLDLAGKEIEPGLRIYEDFDGSNYLYTTGQSANYDDAGKVLEQVKKQYPNSTIVAFEYGSQISVKKAIRKTKK